MSKAALAVSDEPTRAEVNSGRTWDFIQCGHSPRWKVCNVVPIGRDIGHVRMGSAGVVPAGVLTRIFHESVLEDVLGVISGWRCLTRHSRG